MNLNFVYIPVVGAGVLGTFFLTNPTKTLLSTKPSSTNITIKQPRIKRSTGAWSECWGEWGNVNDCVGAIVSSYKLQKRKVWKVPTIR